MRYALLTFCLASTPISADSLQIHLASEHSNGCGTCNERNYGIGWTGEGNIRPTFGYYHNSWFRDSFYGGVNFRVSRYFSFSTILVSGYSESLDGEYVIGGELLPIPVVHYRVLDKRVSPMLSYVPTPDGGVMLFSVDWRVK